MKLIIDVPEEDYEGIKNLIALDVELDLVPPEVEDVLKAIANGRPYISNTEPKGHWVYTSYSNGIGNYHCSKCGTICPEMFNLRDPYPFCPYCGKNLQGEEE